MEEMALTPSARAFWAEEDPSCHITRCIDPRDICLLGGLNPEEAIL